MHRNRAPLPIGRRPGTQLLDSMALLREELLEDANWAEVVDQLNVALRTQKDR
ncbi:DUF2789 family protein [Hydrogenophaga aromaticivorans]|nr:DUF2789 family protein [Hydrogenophaga aromaticivorans]